MPGCAFIGVRQMGELDGRPFVKAMKRNYNKKEVVAKATKLGSLWIEYLQSGILSKFARLEGNTRFAFV